MLHNLYVKNLALIDEIEVEFTKGLNIFDRGDRRREINYSWFCQSCIGRKIFR